MTITTRIAGGKHYGQVRDGKRLVFHTPGYYTAEMALTAAKCWAAFHGEEDNMIKPGDMFETRNKSHQVVIISAGEMEARIRNAKQHGVQVSLMTGEGGREYINLHIGGSSYGRYMRVA
jgi:hypothetical protein